MEVDESRPERCDVLVIGGGPAGSTVATFLSRMGWRVTILEKDNHPRFHIGESLLPRNLPIFDELGVMDEIRQIGVVKRGADFNLPGREGYIVAEFAKALDPRPPIAFQVKRAEFDHVLLQNAARSQVAVHQGIRATAVAFDTEGVHVEARDEPGERSTWDARFLVDASGRDTFLANRLGLKEKDRRHDSVAMFAHFDGVIRRPGEEAGNISLYWFPQGWFWFIPLRDGRMSIGAVTHPSYLKRRDASVQDLFLSTLAGSPQVAERMQNAVLATDVVATGNFSYHSQRMFDRNYLLIGDAFAFIDPVFSTGVYLAMAGGRSAAAAIDGCLREPGNSSRLLARHQLLVKRCLREYAWFIYRFTSPAMQRLFMTRPNPLGIKSAVLSLMSGDTRPSLARSARIVAFKGLYYLFSTFAWQQSRQWSRERRVTT